MEACQTFVGKEHCTHRGGDLEIMKSCCWCGKKWRKLLVGVQMKGHGKFGPKEIQATWEEVTDDNSTS